MANPRQRRKMQSGTAKNTVSKQTVKNKHKVTVKGPALLAEAWDKKKTVRQNYAALGLLSTSNPRLTGGLEPEKHTPYAISSATPATVEDLEAALEAEIGSSSDEEDEDDEESKASTSKVQVEEKLKPGMARIVRDADGNVTGIVVGGQNGEEVEEKVVEPSRAEDDDEEDDDEDDEDEEEEDEENTPWGAPMKDWSVPTAESAPAFGEEEEDQEMDDVPVVESKLNKPKQGIPLGGGVRQVGAKTEVVRQLEHAAQFKTKVIRHTSNAERDWLVALVRKYDDDIAKMARDRKVNVWQRTPGELKRMITKAGGLDKLRAEAAAEPAQE